MTVSTRIWPADGRPAIEAEDPPICRRDYPELLETVSAMLEQRREGFPDRVAASEMTQVEADFEIMLFEDLVAEWTFIVRGGDKPAPRTTRFQQATTLDRSLATIAGIARARGGFGEKLSEQAQRVIALRWHLEPARRTVALAAMSHQLRADAAAKREGKST